MTVQSFDAQSYVRRLRYYDQRGEEPESVAGLAGAITVDIEGGPQDYLQGRLVPLTRWLSLLDDRGRRSRVSTLTVGHEDLSPAESDLHARVLADAQLHA
jgi:hypothetical protein